jgi:hypothetical protein
MPLSRRGFLKAGGIAVASLTALKLGLRSVDESHDPLVDKISFPIKGYPS